MTLVRPHKDLMDKTKPIVQDIVCKVERRNSGRR
jgi:hypothetical protein